MKTSKIPLLFVFAFLIAGRCLVESSDNSVVFVAMLNIVALLIVIFQIAEKLKGKILNKIKTVCLVKDVAKREKRIFLICFYAGLISVNALLIGAYFLWACCNLGNDIISIVALTFSLLDEEIVQLGLLLYRI